MNRIENLFALSVITTALLITFVSQNVYALTLVKARLSANEVARVLQHSLQGTKIVLNNIGPLKNGSYYRKHLSYIVVGKGIGGNGKKQYIALPEIAKRVWRGRYAYYISDIHSKKPTVKATSKGFVATIAFETRGAEMVGRCTAHKLSLKFWNKKKKDVRDCAAIAGRKLMPDIHWQRPALQIAFSPKRYGDSMTFYIDKITVRGEIDAGKACDWKFVGRKICQKIEQYKKEVKKRVGKMLMAQLSTPQVRRKIALTIQRKIDQKTGTSILKIKQVSMNHGIIRVALGL